MSAKFNHHWPAFSGQRTNHERAFTRLELAAVVAGLALLCFVALPLLASTRADSARAACLNNLRLVERAVQMWGAENSDEVPWHTPVPQGTFQPQKVGAAFLEFDFMSNQLVTPYILACPADSGVVVATNFAEFRSVPYRQLAVSYFINLHASFQYPLAPVCGDRNVRLSRGPETCSWGINNAAAVSPFDSNVGWTSAVHGLQGNVVLGDGSTLITTSEKLRQVFQRSPNGDQFSTHVLPPR